MWRSRYAVLMLFLLVGSQGVHSDSGEGGGVESDKKISGSLRHILRSLTLPAEENAEKASPVQIITKHGILEAKPGTSRIGARKLFWGDTAGLDSQPGVPHPVVVSSQTIRISNPNGTSGGKRGRSLTTEVDADGVKTIEGVRVPDDEHDKYHTYRNARVIKNFLVENDRPANPHKKRQIFIQDASQYLAAAGGQGATYIDASSFAQPQAQSYVFSQPQQASQQVVYTATAAPIQQVYTATATPLSATIAGANTIASLTNGNVFSQAQAQPQQQQGQMYVLQPDGKTYLPYSPSTGQPIERQQSSVERVREQAAQQQFASRSGELDDGSNAGKLRQQFEYQQRILSLHQHKEANGQQRIEIHPHSGQVSVSEAPVLLHRIATPTPSEIHHIARVAATALPTGASIRQQLQEQVSAQSARINLEHPGVAQQPAHHVSFRPQNFVQEHQFSTASPLQMNGAMHMPVNPNHFVIKPQTYVNGGGQIFQVPVPVPAGQQGSGEERRDDNEEDSSKEKKMERQTLTSRIMQAFNVNVNRRTAERVETSAVVPVLSSAGLILGLGALAAGWYLSQSNREVGILKKTGKAATTASPKDNAVMAHLRAKRSFGPGGEIDQASFFQSIIQDGIEKQQQQFETEPVREVAHTAAPSRLSSATKAKIAAAEREDRDGITATEKKGKSKGSRLSKFKNFANVAIPSVVLGGSVLFITGLIVYWYFTGKNREIAFLEPSAYSRRRRSLVDSSAIVDSRIAATLASIHTNPFETRVGKRDYQVSDNVGTSKSTSADSDLSYLTVALCMAAFAFGSLMVLGLAWYFTDNARYAQWDDSAPYHVGHFPTLHRHKRSLDARAPFAYNRVQADSGPESTSFFTQLLGNMEFSPSSLLSKLQETDYSQWQETPCAKRIFCDVMTTQSDDTVRLMEKRIAKVLTMFRKLGDGCT